MEQFGLTASSPQDLRGVVADYLFDQGKDVESAALRSGIMVCGNSPTYNKNINPKMVGNDAQHCGNGLGNRTGTGYGESIGFESRNGNRNGNENSSELCQPTNMMMIEATGYGYGEGSGGGDGCGGG